MSNLSWKNKSLIHHFPILFILFVFNLLIGQEQQSSLKISSNPIDYDYWWLQKNNYGKSVTSLEINYRWQLKTSKTTYQINISNAYKETEYIFNSFYHIIDTIVKDEKLYFGESFIKHNFSDQTFLRVGKYYRDFSQYLNDDLSSGSMLVSKNAQPMPKIGLVTSYTLKRNKNITFDFGIAHGFFDKNNYYTDKAPFLHEKFLYLNLKKNNQQFGLGVVHEAMWAGATEEYGNFPSTLKDFLKVVISADGEYEGGPHANAIGNHLGIWDFYYERINNKQILKLYYQHFFEDTSSLRFRNEIDGLWGIELKNYIPDTTILLEYLDTTNSFLNPPYQADFYYWNYQYRIGWRYRSNTIGNPFINRNNEKEFIKLVHVGISGKISSNHYEIKASRRINMNDDILYKMTIGRKIKNKFDLNTFIVNNGKNNGLGISLSRLF